MDNMRLEDFKSILKKKRIDCALFYKGDSSRMNPNLFYFTGYKGVGVLITPAKKEPFLIVPKMEFEAARKSVIKKIYLMKKKKFFESAQAIIKKNKLKSRNIAIDKNHFTLNSFKYFKKQFRNIKTKDIALDCLRLREIKTDKEIKILRKSCDYADKILQKAINDFEDFKTESELAAFLEYETKKLSLELSFNPIVASGKNGSMPHHEPENKKIQKGFCVLDFGVKYKGYCSDITRTVYVGEPSKNEKEIYSMLLDIQEKTINQVKDNKKCSELYDFVNGSLGKYKNNFTHGLGHGVGVEIHELPNLTLNSKDRIKNSMVFTIEPGIYFPGKFGIRVEDTILFKNKPIILTNTSKDLLIV